MEPTFAKEDVWAVAESVLYNFRHNNDRGPDECRFCFAQFNWRAEDGEIRHLPTCSVLVARDLLTGKEP